ncbi:glucose 1-dehydrogenase [Bacillus coahuilensis]|uniref:glucose 1-dehydrogenase n=1 Tax=Bacillus coahuilensis TaxID=408580 RepID=UPI0001850948|nr:glucose 1-dehydrogenase [Bacillus coahuilensis]
MRKIDSLFNSITGKTVIITGGARGLGLHMSSAFAEMGANVVICSRNKELCDKVSEAIYHKGGSARGMFCDVSNKGSIDQVIKETVEEFGTIDVLINNSGTSWIAPFDQYPEDKWDKVMNVNVKGTFLFSQGVASIMKKQGGGKIINLSSITGFGGSHTDTLNAPAYNTSKGAIMTLTKELAVKLAPFNIQVNAIAPGLFPTKMTKAFDSVQDEILKGIPAGRFGEEKDIQGAALFLASDYANYITGHVLVLDGGMTASI